MTKISVIFILIISFFISPTNAQKAVISQIKYKVLYCRFNNPIEVAVSNHSCYDIILKSNNSSIEKIDSNIFLIKPSCKDTIAIRVLGKKDSDTIPLDTVNFIVKLMPDPVARLESFPKNQNIFSPNRLIAKLKDSNYEIEFTVVSFNVIIRRGNKVIDSKLFTSDLLNNEFINMGEKSKNGDRIYFENIMVQREDGELREIGSVYYIISK
ncbi:GldM family protein [candidate division KSB1 bacterium]